MSIATPKPASADIGVVGLGVMGRNLALNLADHGFAVGAYDLRVESTERLIAAHPDGSFGSGYEGRGPGALVPAADVESFVASLRTPRVVVFLITAGGPTDAAIQSISQHLTDGDVIVDGGNAHWEDTSRRERDLRDRGLLFVGSGVSGGEVGARFGPSLMPGGEPQAWEALEPFWTAISAKVDESGRPVEGAAPGRPAHASGAEACTAHIGPGASGHFVKMVHNGIEYADMQCIAEACSLLRGVLGLEPERMGSILAEWNQTELDSYLVEITADILGQTDPETGAPFVDIVLDAAGQKGTGRWTSEASLALGVPAPTIAEAVFARAISSQVETRQAAAVVLRGPPNPEFRGDKSRFVESVRRALYCSKVCAYAQGFALMAAASDEWGWDLDFSSIARIWRGGCIIRARLLHEIMGAYSSNNALPNLMMAEAFAERIAGWQDSWREVVATSAAMGVPAPAFASALAYYDGLRSPRVSASIIQAQRDYFGAHTYERTDRPRGERFHLDWTDPDRPQREVS